MRYYIKVITGFREDQYEIIPMQEAHKAYYLFKNPEERGVFDCGVALIGRNIQEIKPEWNYTMGWNPLHELKADDWNELRSKNIEQNMKDFIQIAKDTANLIDSNKSLMKMKLQDAMTALPKNEVNGMIGEYTKLLSDKLDINK